MGARRLTVIRGLAPLALILAASAGLTGCVVDAADVGEGEEAVAVSASDLQDGNDADQGTDGVAEEIADGDDLELPSYVVSDSSENPGDTRADPRPDPWHGLTTTDDPDDRDTSDSTSNNPKDN